MCLLLLLIYKRGPKRAGSAVAPSEHVTYYGSRLGFPYYNLTTPHREIPVRNPGML
jgi:hypothetical protein